MKRVAAFVVPFALVFAIGMGAWYASNGPGPDLDAPPLEVTWDQLDQLDGPGMVRVKGMAHYTATVRQEVPGGAFREDKSYWLFPFYAPYDAKSRAVRVMVRYDVEPEDLVSYEMVTITGWIDRTTLDKVPYQAENIFGTQSDYFFTDDMLLLEPTKWEPFEDTP